MKIILLRSVAKVGKKDEIVDVPEGYARNALFPKGLAIQATDKTIKELQNKLYAKAEIAALEQSLLEDAYKTLSQKTTTITAPHTKEGALFKKIHEKDIAQAILKEHRISINAADIIGVPFPIKQTGLYTFKSKTFPYSTFTVTIA